MEETEKDREEIEIDINNPNQLRDLAVLEWLISILFPTEPDQEN